MELIFVRGRMTVMKFPVLKTKFVRRTQKETAFVDGLLSPTHSILPEEPGMLHGVAKSDITETEQQFFYQEPHFADISTLGPAGS